MVKREMLILTRKNVVPSLLAPSRVTKRKRRNPQRGRKAIENLRMKNPKVVTTTMTKKKRKKRIWDTLTQRSRWLLA
eukprot:5543843-Amphidinium_carterae.1